MDEAHVQHPVRLVQHGGLDVVDAHGAAFEVVSQPPGGGDDDLGALFQGVNLLANGLSAVEAHQPDAGLELGQVPHLGCDLHSQLPGRGQDDGLNLVAVRVGMLNDGDAESEGLSGTGGGFGGHVLPIQHRGDAPRLNGGGYFIILFFQRPHDFLRQPQAVETDALCDFHNVLSSCVFCGIL